VAARSALAIVSRAVVTSGASGRGRKGKGYGRGCLVQVPSDQH
jgi:hypothetical protein